jgi:hypothetical protein
VKNEVSRDYENAKVVNSVSEEYSIIAEMNCECGGNLEVIMQSLIEKANKYYDVLLCKCKQCEKEEEVIFDINSFFGKIY